MGGHLARQYRLPWLFTGSDNLSIMGTSAIRVKHSPNEWYYTASQPFTEKHYVRII